MPTHKCQECSKSANFNYQGEARPLYCQSHKKEKMTNVRAKRCLDCDKIASYNFPGKNIGNYCAVHKKPSMINISAKYCAEGCGKIACFNFANERRPEYCCDHKKPEMIDIINKSKMCEECGKIRAGYNFEGEINAIRCKKHALDGMILISSHKCAYQGCVRKPLYNVIGQKPKYCNEHKLDNMRDVSHKKCLSCNKRPAFGFTGDAPSYCKTHMKEGMVDVISKRCKECDKRPNFGDPTTKPLEATYCKIHMKAGMVDLKNKLCEAQYCINRASYNLSGLKPKFCDKHKNDGMVNVVSKRCVECDKIPVYNKPGELRGIYCNDHKKSGMVNVKNKTCEKCYKRASFNDPSERIGRFCASHKSDKMIHKSKKLTKCMQRDCENVPLFGLPNKKPILCYFHKEEKMVNVENINCAEEDCVEPSVLIKHGYNYCLKHYPDDSTLDSKIKKMCKICDLVDTHFICNSCNRKQRKKEWEVVNFLKANIKRKAICDSYLPTRECANRRPDIFYECSDHAVIVEVDENQHKSYLPECECSRISEIVGSLGGLPVSIIRFNPDKIKNKGKVIDIQRDVRLQKLLDVVISELDGTPDKFYVKLVQLFYDDDYEVYSDIKTEDITSIVAV